jgi:hypothetical protein
MDSLPYEIRTYIFAYAGNAAMYTSVLVSHDFRGYALTALRSLGRYLGTPWERGVRISDCILVNAINDLELDIEASRNLISWALQYSYLRPGKPLARLAVKQGKHQLVDYLYPNLEDLVAYDGHVSVFYLAGKSGNRATIEWVKTLPQVSASEICDIAIGAGDTANIQLLEELLNGDFGFGWDNLYITNVQTLTWYYFDSKEAGGRTLGAGLIITSLGLEREFWQRMIDRVAQAETCRENYEWIYHEHITHKHYPLEILRYLRRYDRNWIENLGRVICYSNKISHLRWLLRECGYNEEIPDSIPRNIIKRWMSTTIHYRSYDCFRYLCEISNCRSIDIVYTIILNQNTRLIQIAYEAGFPLHDIENLRPSKTVQNWIDDLYASN